MVVRRTLAACWSLAVASILAGSAMAATPLNFDWDKRTDTTRGVATNSFGDVLAEETWPGAVPIVLDYDGEEAEVPTTLLVAIRDQLDQAVDPEAPEAAAFIRSLLGADADTPIDQIPDSRTTRISLGSVLFGEQCGREVGTDGECVIGIDHGNSICAGFSCKRTSVEQRP